ncbi:hypothetical protein P7C73_g5969, partial [Tremellales sp. Uapishka_1]
APAGRRGQEGGYGKTRIGKVPQRLLGPKPFPLDRFLAIFAAIYAEHAERPEDLQASLSDSSSSEDADEWDDATIKELAEKAGRKRTRQTERDERWEEQVDHLTMSVKLWALIPELEGMGLLKRMSPVERLDNVMLRCEVDYETVKDLAKELRITLDEYLYETAY